MKASRRSGSSTGEENPQKQGQSQSITNQGKESGLLTVNEVARYLQVEKTTIYNWAKAGNIPAFKIGRLWHFRQDEIAAWLEDHTTRPWD